MAKLCLNCGSEIKIEGAVMCDSCFINELCARMAAFGNAPVMPAVPSDNVTAEEGSRIPFGAGADDIDISGADQFQDDVPDLVEQNVEPGEIINADDLPDIDFDF